MTKKQKKMLFRILISAALTAALVFVPAEGIIKLFLYLIPYLIIGYDILIKAVKGIFNRHILDENILMAVATVGAFAIAVTRSGDYLDAVAVMLLYQTGELFQSCAVGKSRRNISELMDIRPDYANIEQDGKLIKTDPEEIPTGSIIVVLPGEKIPIDGVIEEGSSSLNTAALTGESVPVDVKIGDEVISGSINLTGVLKIRTTKEFGESTVSKILDLVENASSRKSRSENFISRFAEIYTPIVCLSSLAVGVIPPLFNMLIMGSPAEWSEWIYRGLTFLVISCPCALVISVPLSFFAGLGGASREGILIKGSNYLEALSKTDCVVFDKTGTLTEGVFTVTSVESVNMDKEKLIELTAITECTSSHPVAKSLIAAYGRDIDRSRISHIAEISGKGVTAVVDGMKTAVGNIKLMEQLNISCPEADAAGTVVYVAIEGKYEGYIVISDVIKNDSRKAIELLKKTGVRKTVMLTGDVKRVAEETAERLGIDEVYSHLLPADKVEKVEKLLGEQKARATLAFVGDGINDAPVLSRADIGIAMGAMGSDAAIEAADIVLMDDNPLKIAKAIKISRKCMAIVYENIVFALGVKAVCLILGLFGIANMWIAVFADVGVMIIAVLNSIRALIKSR